MPDTDNDYLERRNIELSQRIKSLEEVIEELLNRNDDYLHPDDRAMLEYVLEN